MGAKAGILALGDRDFTESLRQLPRADAERAVALVTEIFPGYQIEPVQGRALEESTYPDDDVVYALSTPGIDIMCDQRFILGKPSDLPAHVLDVAAGRAVALCAMHTVDDSDLGQQAMRFLFGFALEGLPEPDDVNAAQITMLGYRVTDPTGAEQAAREAALREFLRQTSRRSYRIGPAGSLAEIDGDPT